MMAGSEVVLNEFDPGFPILRGWGGSILDNQLVRLLDSVMGYLAGKDL